MKDWTSGGFNVTNKKKKKKLKLNKEWSLMCDSWNCPIICITVSLQYAGKNKSWVVYYNSKQNKIKVVCYKTSCYNNNWR